MKRIVIEVKPSIDPRKGPALSYNANGFSGPLDILQTLHAVVGDIYNKTNVAAIEQRLQATRSPAGPQ